MILWRHTRGHADSDLAIICLGAPHSRVVCSALAAVIRVASSSTEMRASQVPFTGLGPNRDSPKETLKEQLLDRNNNINY